MAGTGRRESYVKRQQSCLQDTLSIPYQASRPTIHKASIIRRMLPHGAPCTRRCRRYCNGCSLRPNGRPRLWRAASGTLTSSRPHLVVGRIAVAPLQAIGPGISVGELKMQDWFSKLLTVFPARRSVIIYHGTDNVEEVNVTAMEFCRSRTHRAQIAGFLAFEVTRQWLGSVGRRPRGAVNPSRGGMCHKRWMYNQRIRCRAGATGAPYEGFLHQTR